MPGWQKAPPRTIWEIWALQAFLELHFHNQISCGWGSSCCSCMGLCKFCRTDWDTCGDLNYLDGENHWHLSTKQIMGLVKFSPKEALFYFPFHTGTSQIHCSALAGFAMQWKRSSPGCAHQGSAQSLSHTERGFLQLQFCILVNHVIFNLSTLYFL